MWVPAHSQYCYHRRFESSSSPLSSLLLSSSFPLSSLLSFFLAPGGLFVIIEANFSRPYCLCELLTLYVQPINPSRRASFSRASQTSSRSLLRLDSRISFNSVFAAFVLNDLWISSTARGPVSRLRFHLPNRQGSLRGLLGSSIGVSRAGLLSRKEGDEEEKWWSMVDVTVTRVLAVRLISQST